MKFAWYTLAISVCLAIVLVQCEVARECRDSGGTPVRGVSKAVECIKPGAKP